MTHTKGPWKMTPFSSVVGCPITAQPDPQKNTVIIAGVHGAFGDDYRSEVIANARLIAAAPELLEAALAAHAALSDGGIEYTPMVHAAFHKLGAAIAKSTGGIT